MAEIGIERLGAGDREKHRAERDEADDAVMQHERDGMQRIEREQHLGMPHDRGDRRDRDDGEPDAITGPKKAATRAVPRDCTANSTNRMTTVSGTT